jgi:hypothetical protein
MVIAASVDFEAVSTKIIINNSIGFAVGRGGL